MPERLPRGRGIQLLRKYDFDYRPVTKPRSLYVEWDDIRDILHILRSRKRCYITEMLMLQDEYRLRYFSLIESCRFRIMMEVNPYNHPHLEEVLPKDTILHYADAPHHGVINFDQGIPLLIGDHFCQVNYEFIRLLNR